jgi:ribonuclease PH
MGNTKVLCNATVEENLPRWPKTNKNRHGWVTAEYAMLPRATQQRNQRETLTPKGRTQEIKRLVGRSLRGAVDLEKLGDRQIIIDCDVIQADGGTRTASVTGGYVALALAVLRLEKRQSVPPGTLRQAVAAVSVGILDGKAVLDLDYEMDLKADVDMNIVMAEPGRDGHSAAFQGAERSANTGDDLARAAEVNIRAGRAIRRLIRTSRRFNCFDRRRWSVCGAPPLVGPAVAGVVAQT